PHSQRRRDYGHTRTPFSLSGGQGTQKHGSPLFSSTGVGGRRSQSLSAPASPGSPQASGARSHGQASRPTRGTSPHTLRRARPRAQRASGPPAARPGARRLAEQDQGDS